MKKFISELIGTFILVFLGCGTAMLVGCNPTNGEGYLLTAFAFGLAVTAMAYSIGNVSGCHVNPAVSLAMFLRSDISFSELIHYCIAQMIGAFLGSALLFTIFFMGGLEDQTKALASNSATHMSGNMIAALIIETVLTFIFVLTVLGVTSADTKHKHVGGIVIGSALTLVHIIGIGLTGTSVNPARSLGPALVALITGNVEPISVVWIFIIGPFVGAVLAAFCHKAFENN